MKSTITLDQITVGCVLQIAGSEVPYVHLGKCRLTNIISGETSQFAPATAVRSFASVFFFNATGYWADWKALGVDPYLDRAPQTNEESSVHSSR